MSDIFTIDTVQQAFGQAPQQNNFKEGFAVELPEGFVASAAHFGSFMQQLANPKVLEIGCDMGYSTKFLLDSNPSLTLYGVDPYDDYVDWNGNTLSRRQEMYQIVMDKFQSYGDRFKLTRLGSDDAASTFEDEFFDLVFIDGLHTYEQVKKDCENYYSKCKTGSIFAGHDYNVIEGVNRAVKEFAASVGKTIMEGEQDTWFWIK